MKKSVHVLVIIVNIDKMHGEKLKIVYSWFAYRCSSRDLNSTHTPHTPFTADG